MGKHSHYLKDVRDRDTIDVYDVLDLFEVESHPLGHAIKKLLMAGKRGAKSYRQDLQEAIDSIARELEINALEPSEVDLIDGVQGWNFWYGGKRPVGENDLVKVMLRNGDAYECRASLISWSHLNLPTDAIAYRLVEEN